MTKDYHLIYRKENFSKELLEGIERFLDKEMDKTNINLLYLFLKDHFKIDKPLSSIKIYDNNETALNDAIYLDCSKEIIFYKIPTLITVLHELRHYIQFNSDLSFIELDYDDKEEDARAWSASLYYSCFPERYMDLYKSNKLKFK